MLKEELSMTSWFDATQLALHGIKTFCTSTHKKRAPLFVPTKKKNLFIIFYFSSNIERRRKKGQKKILAQPFLSLAPIVGFAEVQAMPQKGTIKISSLNDRHKCWHAGVLCLAISFLVRGEASCPFFSSSSSSNLDRALTLTVCWLWWNTPRSLLLPF